MELTLNFCFLQPNAKYQNREHDLKRFLSNIKHVRKILICTHRLGRGYIYEPRLKGSVSSGGLLVAEAATSRGGPGLALHLDHKATPATVACRQVGPHLCVAIQTATTIDWKGGSSVLLERDWGGVSRAPHKGNWRSRRAETGLMRGFKLGERWGVDWGHGSVGQATV